MQNAPRIELRSFSQCLQVHVDGTLLADTSHTIELRGRGYPLRQYILCEDVRMDLLKPYKTETHCPFKAGAAQFSFGQHTDVAWSYERPAAGIVAIERG